MAALCAASAPVLSCASTWIVNSCDEGNSGDIPTKTGTLRFATANAASGDMVDMSGLGCSTITLTTGAIVVSQNTLTLHGPGRKALTITGKGIGPPEPSRIIVHNYATNHSGHLHVDNLRVGYGTIAGSGTVHGGCIASLAGSLSLANVGVYYCSATTTGLSTDVPTPNAFGGGVFAYAGLTISNSVLLHNGVYSTNPGVRTQGGCATTFGPFDMSDSSVAYCKATGPTGTYRVRGGALELKGSVIITGSIIGKGYSNNIGGVDIVSNAPAALTATISNSTITYNSALGLIGGLYANSGQVNINNSTIAFNTAGHYTYTYNAKTYNAAVGVSISSIGAGFSLQSTIIANNSSNGVQEDLSFGASTGLTFAASKSLVRAYLSDVTLPSGQGNLTGVCPLLGPIRDNGGGSFTHALQSGSPAIDAGDNTANDPHTGVPALYDQRGIGYARVSGSSADIGAYEVQKNDIVFDTGFDGCP